MSVGADTRPERGVTRFTTARTTYCARGATDEDSTRPCAGVRTPAGRVTMGDAGGRSVPNRSSRSSPTNTLDGVKLADSLGGVHSRAGSGSTGVSGAAARERRTVRTAALLT